MDDFEYSIQLNDRDWAEFFWASEECALAPAALATAEEQSLSDIEQGDVVLGRDCPASTDGHSSARVGSRPGAGTGNSTPRGVPGDTSLLSGHLSPSELLSGSEDEAELGSVGRFLCDSDKPGHPPSTPMPSVQGTQPPCPPTATLASPAGGTAESSPGQYAACEAATPQPALEKGAASSRQAMEPPNHPSGAAPEQGGHAGGEQPHGSPAVAQPRDPVLGTSPALAASPKASARKNPGNAAHQELGPQGPPHDHPPSPALDSAPKGPSSPAREETSRERGGTETNPPAASPDVVRPKVPGQPRKSRKQRGTSISEGDREPVKTPLGSPLSPRRSKGKEKAAKPALVKLGSEEAAENKRLVPTPGTDEGDPSLSIAPKQKVKEPAAQPLGKAKATTKHPKPGQAGGLGVRDNVPVIAASAATATPAEPCQEAPQELLHPQIVVASGGDAAQGACGEPVAETPRELCPPCFAAGASARADTLEVTWPEMYDYLFCDSQGEEEGMGDSTKGERTPLEREISLPELYEYFFNEPEGNRKKAKGKERKRKRFSSLDHAQLQNEDPKVAPVKDSLVVSVPEVYEYFFRDWPGDRRGWRRMFSIPPASEVKKAVGAVKSFLQRHLARGQAPAPQALVRRGSGEKLPLVPLAPLGRGQRQTEGLDMALALRGGPEIPLALTHKDMCLVFCAFASWAVKTSDLQAPDAWKTMFLASFGTLSAIRYFRRQVREGHPRT
ncbi:PERM1 protein, partial [Brachypteracias leptosomus]|nr:PERM1 protein [Brachypteracias leptosomus]